MATWTPFTACSPACAKTGSSLRRMSVRRRFPDVRQSRSFPRPARTRHLVVLRGRFRGEKAEHAIKRAGLYRCGACVFSASRGGPRNRKGAHEGPGAQGPNGRCHYHAPLHGSEDIRCAAPLCSCIRRLGTEAPYPSDTPPAFRLFRHGGTVLASLACRHH